MLFGAADALALLCRTVGEGWAEDRTLERPWGWVFIHAEPGHGPVFVNRLTSAVLVFGTTPPLDELLELYEKGLADEA